MPKRTFSFRWDLLTGSDRGGEAVAAELLCDLVLLLPDEVQLKGYGGHELNFSPEVMT